MSRPTVASLTADLAATRAALNTYIGLHNQLADEVKALRERPATPAPRPVPVRRILSREQRERAAAAFFASHPHAKCASTEQLLAYVG